MLALEVKRQLRAGHLFSTEGVANQAHYLGLYEIAHRGQGFETYLDDLSAVTAEDVVRVLEGRTPTYSVNAKAIQR